MNRSGIQLAVCMSCVRRRSSPVFLRRSRNSSTSRCHVSRYAQTAPLRLPPWLTATAVSLATLRKGTTPWLWPLVPWMWDAEWPAHCVQSLPMPPPTWRAGRCRTRLLKMSPRSSHHRRQVAGGELRVARAGVEQGRRGRGEAEGGDQVVELDRPLLAVAPRFSARPIATRIQSICGSSMRRPCVWMSSSGRRASAGPGTGT